MSRNAKISIGFAILLSAVLFGVVAIWLAPPTPAPAKSSVDFLNIAVSLHEIEERVLVQKAKATIESNSKGVVFSDLSEDEKKQVLEKSFGLVRQVSLRNDGAISVRAVIAAKPKTEGATVVEVNILFVPEKMDNGQFRWRCYGDPISALPGDCLPTPTR